MTDRRRAEDRRVRTGRVLLLSLGALALAVFFLDEVLDSFTPTSPLVITTGEPASLSSGSDVLIAGRPAGRVRGVEFLPAHEGGEGRRAIRVEITRTAARTLREDASARVASQGLLGAVAVQLDPGSPGGEPLDLSDTLAAEPLIDRAEFRERAESLRTRLDSLAPLARELRVALREGGGTLAALRRDTALLREMSRSAEGAAELRERARDGTLARLLTDDSLHVVAGRILERAREGTAEPPTAEREAAALTESLERLEARVGSLERRLREGRGSLGRALHDDALQREVRTLRARADSVTAEIVGDPLRWLRFRLF